MKTFLTEHIAALRAYLGTRRGNRRARRYVALSAGIVAISLVAGVIAAIPVGPSDEQVLAAYIDKHSQTMVVDSDVPATVFARDLYSATPGIETLAASGTNYDWAKLVMLSGGWPMSDNNITVMLRWMRQENGTADWWNRNNPLNNGFGSGGGGGTGSYANLVIAAQKCAEALSTKSGYSQIVAGFASSADPSVTEAAIWASPWASGHYANGGHWSYAPVDQVTSPSGTW